MMDGYLGGSPVMATRWQLSLSAVECSAVGDSKRTRLHLEQHGSAVSTVLSTRDPERPVFAMVFEYYGRLVEMVIIEYDGLINLFYGGLAKCGLMYKVYVHKRYI